MKRQLQWRLELIEEILEPLDFASQIRSVLPVDAVGVAFSHRMAQMVYLSVAFPQVLSQMLDLSLLQHSDINVESRLRRGNGGAKQDDRSRTFVLRNASRRSKSVLAIEHAGGSGRCAIAREVSSADKCCCCPDGAA